AEVGWTRYYLESDKTRIVFFLDEIPQYKVHYDKENNTISITLSDAYLGKPSKKFNVNSAFINSISLKQTDNNTVDVKISLPKPANYKVFDIKSPALMIVDVTSAENVLRSDELASSSENQKNELNTVTKSKQIDNPVKINAPTQISNENKLNKDNPEVGPPESTELSIMNLQWQALESLNGNILAILQYVFDLLVFFLVIYVIIKIRSIDKIARYIRRNRRRLKDNPVFADILNEIEKGNKYNLSRIAKSGSEEDKEKSAKEAKPEDKKDDNDESKIKQYDKVQELAKKGIDPISISQKSNIPIGEVNLILDLIRARKDS
ncbi:MAG: AMIN domain-containing protein, partial [Candidatus Poribacteria bacterium]